MEQVEKADIKQKRMYVNVLKIVSSAYNIIINIQIPPASFLKKLSVDFMTSFEIAADSLFHYLPRIKKPEKADTP